MIDKNIMLGRRVHRSLEDRQNVAEWRMKIEKWDRQSRESGRTEQVKKWDGGKGKCEVVQGEEGSP